MQGPGTARRSYQHLLMAPCNATRPRQVDQEPGSYLRLGARRPAAHAPPADFTVLSCCSGRSMYRQVVPQVSGPAASGQGASAAAAVQ
jgi:hypothetical protein